MDLIAHAVDGFGNLPHFVLLPGIHLIFKIAVGNADGSINKLLDRGIDKPVDKKKYNGGHDNKSHNSKANNRIFYACDCLVLRFKRNHHIQNAQNFLSLG